MQAMSDQLDVAAGSLVTLQHEISMRVDNIEAMHVSYAACDRRGLTLVEQIKPNCMSLAKTHIDNAGDP